MRKYITLFFFLSIATLSARAQNAEKDKDGELYVLVEEMPEFPGGQDAMFKYLADNIKYPEAERERNHSGTVYIYFIIDKTGKVTGTKVARGVAGAPGFDEEALRVVNAMPDWKAGRQKGENAAVQLTLPVKFVLNSK